MKLAYILIILLSLNPLTVNASEVTCIPEGQIFNHVFSSMNKLISGFKDADENNSLDDLKDKIDQQLFNQPLSDLDRNLVFNFASSVDMKFLINKINKHCDGNLFQTLEEVKSPECYTYLGLIELKIISKKFGFEQHHKDIDYEQCKPIEFKIDTPYTSQAPRG